MQIKIASNDPQSMLQDGDSVLNSLQNKTLPIVDIIIRESLQNSLDAQIKDEKDTIVDININTFDSDEFAKNLETVSDNLMKKYNGQQLVLSISDKKTNGLTGNFKTNNQETLSKSNFQKLIFGLGKKQTSAGAGGSWGLGKTSYSLIGSGIVLYYTRIKLDDNSYEERLIGALIENPNEKELRILPESERGIAWWGEFASDGETIYPLTDRQKIKEVLDTLGIKPYQDETGTTVIIPYIQNEKDKSLALWQDDLRMSVQRWYGPRILNDTYHDITGNSRLVCSVNGILIHPDFEPYFDIAFNYVRDVYTSALSGESINEKIQVNPIYGRNRSFKDDKKPIGYLAYTELTPNELKMESPYNELSLLEKCLLIEDVDQGKGQTNIVIAHARKPGMIVSYDYNGDWSPKIALENEDNTILGFFVPISSTKLSKSVKARGNFFDLESYLRGIERADHAQWDDVTHVTIVKYIMSDVANIIRNSFISDEELKRSSPSSLLSRTFGEMFLPPRNYGKRANKPRIESPTQSTTRGGHKKNCGLIIKNSTFITNDEIQILLDVKLKKAGQYRVLCEVQSSDSLIDYEQWQREISSELTYPFEIMEFNVIEDNDQLLYEKEYEIISDNNEVIINYIGERSIELSAKVSLKVLQKQYSPSITIREVRDHDL